jgi:hypothetical protein
VNWFEQLDWLSKNVPDSQNMVLTELIMQGSTGGGTMNLRALLKNSSLVSNLEETLRDGQHDIKPGDKSEVRNNPLYGFQYNFSVSLKNEQTPPKKTPEK